MEELFEFEKDERENDYDNHGNEDLKEKNLDLTWKYICDSFHPNLANPYFFAPHTIYDCLE